MGHTIWTFVTPEHSGVCGLSGDSETAEGLNNLSTLSGDIACLRPVHEFQCPSLLLSVPIVLLQDRKSALSREVR